MIPYIKDMLNTSWGACKVFLFLALSVAVIMYALEIAVRIYNRRRRRPW